MKAPRVVVSANASDAGKTLITTALLWLLKRKGYSVQPFKIGPDFIDPGYHTYAAGLPSRNLDSWIMDEAAIRRSFAENAGGADLAVIEGVRGLYEGASPTSDEGSTAHVAKILRSPVVVVLNCHSLTRSAAAIVLGLKALDREVDIAGVILNKVGDQRHEEKLRSAISHYTSTPVIGSLYRDNSLSIPKRHLGLLTVQENSAVVHTVESVGRTLEERLDIDALLRIMEEAPEIEAPAVVPADALPAKIRIGIFRDPVFTFYYPENVESLQRLGAEIVPMNSLSDPGLGQVSGLLIGGGYPEVFAKRLEENQGMRAAVKRASEDGMPIVGECGGLMYLCASIAAGESKSRMVGVFDAEAVMRSRPQALSYVLLRSVSANPLVDPGDSVRGHEFHYSELESVNGARFAFRVERGKGIMDSMDGMISHSTLGTYAHLHCLAYPKMADNFIAACRLYGRH